MLSKSEVSLCHRLRLSQKREMIFRNFFSLVVKTACDSLANIVIHWPTKVSKCVRPVEDCYRMEILPRLSILDGRSQAFQEIYGIYKDKHMGAHKHIL